MQVLLFLSLRDITPSNVENTYITGGTMYRKRVMTTLGRYPVTSCSNTFLHGKRKKIKVIYIYFEFRWIVSFHLWTCAQRDSRRETPSWVCRDERGSGWRRLGWGRRWRRKWRRRPPWSCGSRGSDKIRIDLPRTCRVAPEQRRSPIPSDFYTEEPPKPPMQHTVSWRKLEQLHTPVQKSHLTFIHYKINHYLKWNIWSFITSEPSRQLSSLQMLLESSESGLKDVELFPQNPHLSSRFTYRLSMWIDFSILYILSASS